ncbi:MAG TPA: DUF3014 domain-containing protein [Vicinamibacterales bacterium]|nr:DUF3014 domain-containing protein [Vicinamibacterales bacterium]
MAFDDLPLERTDAPPPPPPVPPSPPLPSGAPTRWIVLGAVAVVAGALLALWWLSRAHPETATPPATAATDVAVPRNRPKPQPIDLPPLDASDTALRTLVAALSKHPLLSRLLATKDLVRNATLATVQIGDGKTPATPLLVLRPATHVAIAGTASGRLDPASYARWDSATAALTSINPPDLAQLYVNTQLLFDQAYRELGHPNAGFDEAIVRAINTLGATPQVDQDPVLVRRSGGLFEHEDQNLRGLLPVQKQFLLMGPDNRRKIMGWLKQFAIDLDLKVD